MKHQTHICFIAIQAFFRTAALLGIGATIAINYLAVAHAQATTYVVDQTAPGAADTNPGTEAKPFKTVQHAAETAGPGDTVYVMAGKYNERVKVKAGGTEGKPIAFVAMPRRSATVGGFDLEASYIRVEGFEITADKPVIEYNLTFKTSPLADGTNINGKDPLFVDPQNRNFRLKHGSPAIGVGKDGVTIGALEYPNVYYVDPRHPAASDEPAWGYPAVPLASLVRACTIAQPGETIILREGVYREILATKHDGVTIRAMKGEKVTISGADLIKGWKREADGSSSAPLAAEPKKLLRDGRTWSKFSYDKAAGRIMVKSGGDPSVIPSCLDKYSQFISCLN